MSSKGRVYFLFIREDRFPNEKMEAPIVSVPSDSVRIVYVGFQIDNRTPNNFVLVHDVLHAGRSSPNKF